MKSIILASVIGMSSLALSTVANAIPITYFGENTSPAGTVSGDPVTARSAFLAALSGGVSTENFEGFSDGASAPLVLSFPGSTGSISATLSGAGTDIVAGAGAGRFATSGSKFVETPGGGDFVIDFSSPIAAFGFFGTDLGDIGNDLEITLTDTSLVDSVFKLDLAGTPNGGLIFWGFTDTTTQYTKISFDNTPGSGDVFGFDDMTIGDSKQVKSDSSVPVSGSQMLLGLGLAGIAFSRRRKTKS